MKHVIIILGMVALCFGCRGTESRSSDPRESPRKEESSKMERASKVEYSKSKREATWTDSASGLTWQVVPTGGKVNWSPAKQHCSDLRLAGQDDWRLPTMSELRTLIRGCPSTVTGGDCRVANDSVISDARGCEGCSSGPSNRCFRPEELTGVCGNYWSSSAVPDIVDGVWVLSSKDGGIGYSMAKRHSLAVRCVR